MYRLKCFIIYIIIGYILIRLVGGKDWDIRSNK